jgi:hypothetical protein
LNAEKKHVIHEQWLDKSYRGWLNIKIQNTVRGWLAHPRRNYGIEVKVFDSDLKALDASNIFNIYNCSSDADLTGT